MLDHHLPPTFHTRFLPASERFRDALQSSSQSSSKKKKKKVQVQVQYKKGVVKLSQ
jgi:hypothetical protein